MFQGRNHTDRGRGSPTLLEMHEGSDTAAEVVVVSKVAERSELTSLQGLAALSLDALSSVAYGPEAVVLVLAVAGSRGLNATLPVTIGIAALLVLLTVSYRQVIAVHPDGGGAYAISKTDLGPRMARLAAASLIVDYVLTVAVSIAAGVAALTSAFPKLRPHTTVICLVILVVLAAINLVGLSESAKLLIGPTVLFVVGILGVIVIGLLRSHPATRTGGAADVPVSVGGVGVLLVVQAFAAGCTSLTGVEAIANAVPAFRPPRIKRAQRTEVMLGVLLGAMLLGLSILVGKFDLRPRAGVTLLDQLTAAAYGHGVAYYALGLTTTAILAFAANTSFGGLPVLFSLLARDHLLPHWFGLRGEKPVYRYGVTVLALFAGVLLVSVGGSTQRLIPLFAIGVFIGFTLSQAGLVRHWYRQRPPRWRRTAALNGLGAVLSAVAAVVFLASKFIHGAWLLLIIIPALMALFGRVAGYYARVGEALQPDRTPAIPALLKSTVIVPVGGINRLTEQALSAALSMGQRVVALTVQPDEESAAALRANWGAWACGVQLEVLVVPQRTLVDPVITYVRSQEGPGVQVTVLIPLIEPRHLRYQILQNQRGVVLANQLRLRTDVTVATIPFRFGD
jgi:amino acid transporter